jgi:hypothetical protein
MTANRRLEGADELREMVREGYTRVVQGRGAADRARAEDVARHIGCSDDEPEAVPGGANLEVGCGNPTAIALDAFSRSPQRRPTALRTPGSVRPVQGLRALPHCA